MYDGPGRGTNDSPVEDLIRVNIDFYPQGIYPNLQILMV